VTSWLSQTGKTRSLSRSAAKIKKVAKARGPGDRFAALPQGAPGDGRHDQLWNFQTALLGRITPASTPRVG
jgi:hypothetical protein